KAKTTMTQKSYFPGEEAAFLVGVWPRFLVQELLASNLLQGSRKVCEKGDLPYSPSPGPSASGKRRRRDGSFPVASDLCTRHATQIVLRRPAAHESAIRISIIPDPSNINNAEKKAGLEKFVRCIKDSAFGMNEFAALWTR
ncbi:hypothetical protein LTR98_011649, partial [Exophiala xenobiotica]